ncbi:MAG: hypothetical protein AAFW89_11935 [Bacteroidota bacterium]
MSFDGFDDELWDEFKWEAHLNEVEQKSEQLRKFIASDTADIKGNVPRWVTLLKESLSEVDAYEAFVEEELLMDEAYFPEDDDDWEDEDEWDDEDFLFGEYDEFMDMEEGEEEDFDAGEEWKELSEAFTYSEYGSLENLKPYNDAKELSVAMLKWTEKIPQDLHSPVFQQCIDEVLKIGAKLAGGYSFGFEPEYIGANIAYSKKALTFANTGLSLLQQLKSASYFDQSMYQQFHGRLFELRNDIGVHIQELRDQFNAI